jgi:aminoglycoside 3-N-acetyltransferase
MPRRDGGKPVIDAFGSRPLERLRSLRQRYGLRHGVLREAALQRDRLFNRVTDGVLADDLRRLGVRPGDTVFVHTALSRIGHVVGGPETVVRAVQRVVGDHGTILMPAFSWGGLVLDYVRQSPVFDVQTTPCALGTIPEAFRHATATHRSLHPTHSVAGWGRLAEELLAGHEAAGGPFGRGTPFVRCLEAGGRGLVVGARVHNYTTLRAIEDERHDYPYPIYWPKTFTLDVIDRTGRRLSVNTKVHNPLLGPYRNGDLLIPHLKAQGLLVEGRVGRAAAYLIEGKDLLTTLGDLVDRRIFPFTISPEEYRQRHGPC